MFFYFSLNDNENVPGSENKLRPVMAFESSTWDGKEMYSAERCIDGVLQSDRSTDMCHTLAEPAPWVAISFADYGHVFAVGSVVLFQRLDCCWWRTRNVEIRLADEMPKSAQKMFSGGELLGTFAGPAKKGQKVEIHSVPGWEKKFGRYLIIQMNNGKEPLNLMEVLAFGNIKSEGMYKQNIWHTL